MVSLLRLFMFETGFWIVRQQHDWGGCIKFQTVLCTVALRAHGTKDKIQANDENIFTNLTTCVQHLENMLQVDRNIMEVFLEDTSK